MDMSNKLSLSPVVLNYAKALHTEQQNGGPGFHLFSSQKTQPTADPRESFDEFLKRIAAGCMIQEDVDASHPLSHYYISSSHNTYLSGNQLYGHASARPYTHVLENGCRCVEIDVWNGEELDDSNDDESDSGRLKDLRQRFDKKLHLLSSQHSKVSSDAHNVSESHIGQVEPRVLHGHTATKEVSFRKVCEVIRDHAFSKSELPLIVSLEIHTNPQQQQIMVDIMHEKWGPFLVDSDVLANESTPLPSLESLCKKILIKVKFSKPEKAVKTAKPDTSDADSSEDEAVEQIKKGNIIEALGSMGIYTRSCHFKSFSQPEAELPTHVFALSESKLIDLHERDPSALLAHNKHYLMRAYPKGLRVSSSNLDPTPFWRQGVQMVALNWQNLNAAMMLNHGMFSGTGGWVLKPPGYLPDSSPHRRGTLNLTIQVFAGHNIGPAGKRPHVYIRCELHVEQHAEKDSASQLDAVTTKDGEFKAHTSTARGGRDADFERQGLKFNNIKGVTEELSFVRFKMMDDQKLGRDDCIAWACFRLSRLREGVGLVRLFDEKGEATDGILLVRVLKNFEVDGSAPDAAATATGTTSTTSAH